MTTAVKRVAFVALLAMAGRYAYVRLQGPHGWSDLQEKRKTIAALEDDNRKIAQDVERRKKRNWDLQHNEDVIQPEIRQRTNKLLEGEVEFQTPKE